MKLRHAVTIAAIGPCVCFAWLPTGHEQVADIAWAKLRPNTKLALYDVLMAGDKEFRPATNSDADVRAAFRRCSTWADWIKETKTGIYEAEIDSWNRAFQPRYDPNDTQREAHRCRRWHYFDVPIRAGDAEPGVEGSNALVAMTAARYELAAAKGEGPADKRSQCWWLYWTAHVVGDLHQPLHCVSNFEHEKQGDAGGNLFRLGVPYPDNPQRMMNLHFYWDQGIENAIKAEWGQPEPFETVTTKWTLAYAPEASMAADSRLSSWIGEGARLAESVIYSGIDRGGQISADYASKQAELCRRQAVLAGFRLAAQVEAAFGD